MALVVGLIIGINAVFKMAADTVGTGQALSAKMRDGRAAQAVIFGDLSHAVVRGSEFRFLVIDSRTQFAFRDVRDKENDHDYDAVNDNTFVNQDKHTRTLDMDGDNTDGTTTVPGEYLPVGVVNDRGHRVDTLSFFAKDLYRRQTGNQGVFIDNMASQDAWITYGHGRVFDQTGDANVDDDVNHYPMPGAPPTQANPNPKNFYASDWALLRSVMLVMPPNADIVSGPPLDGIVDDLSKPVAQAKQTFWATTVGTSKLADLIPMGRTTQAGDNTQTTASSGGVTISSNRYDIIPKNIKIGGATGQYYPDLRDILSDYIEHTNYFIGGTQLSKLDDKWWDLLPSSASVYAAGGGPPGRFRCNPYPTRTQMLNTTTASTASAELAPVFLGNCTQFIVEFAGDYLTQSTKNDATYGDITAIGPDGVTDFFVEQVNLGGKQVPQQRIRWYGFPRDVNGDGFVAGWSDSKTANKVGANHNDLVDVVPLRDVIQSYDSSFYKNISSNKANWNIVRFERSVVTSDPGLPLPANNEYMPQPPNNEYINLKNPTAGLPTTARYVCAWAPDDANKPTMLRIIFRVDDPNGRLADAQSNEFVVKLP